MACRLPGGVTSPDELWDLLAEERTTVGPPPPERGGTSPPCPRTV
ncbi:beta-ketoacyl synthase N-terminal-like domain-containing protein [Streptomyces indonesiensis]